METWDPVRNGPVSHALFRAFRLHRHAAAGLLRGLGLHPGQELVMIHLGCTRSARQSDLVKLLDLDPSTVTKMLQRLEQAGHVRRLPDPEDRRAVLVEATDTSSHLLNEIERVWRELEEDHPRRADAGRTRSVPGPAPPDRGEPL